MSFSQLNDFNLSVTPIDESCSGNGALQMSVSNTTTGSTIIYTLYLLPDTTNPVAQTTENSFDNLQAGNYQVVALQILGDEENSQQQNATINDLTTELDFDISHNSDTSCSATSTIIVNIISGNPISYEIISGPVIVAPQSSNEFANLPQGTYNIRVFDDCGNALSKTYTMFLEAPELEISGVSQPVIYDSCSEMVITNTITTLSDSPIVYPLTVTYTIFPPDGSANQTIIQTVTSGTSSGFEISQLLSLYGDLTFSINISILDTCGNVFDTDAIIDPNPKVNMFTTDGFCGPFLNVIINGYLPPYTLNFTEVPIGFNPVDFNTEYPGPFSTSITTYGTEEDEVPYGNYSVEVIDACGRTGSLTYLVEEDPIEPLVTRYNNGCESEFGFLSIRIPDRDIVSGTIIDAPNTFQQTLPLDVSQFIENGVLTIENLPVGNFIISVFDECGDEYIIETNIPEFMFSELTVNTTPNCLSETGTLRIASGNGTLETITITSAPIAFSDNLPQDVSSNINSSNGIFFINNLPIGNYILEVTDVCGYNYSVSVDIFSYENNPSAYTLNRNCGSFDLGINDNDGNTTEETYWWQRYFPDTDTWGHPYTGVSYTEGTIPNATNAIEIQDQEIIYNIFITGDFRLIKVFKALNNGNTSEFCLDVFATFMVSSELIISGVYNLDCDGGSGPSDVVLDVIGVEPYNFSITSPFFFDNGNNNVFTDLAPGTYDFQVEDICGSIQNTTVNLENLLPLVRVNTAESMLVCRNDGLNFDVFNLTSQNSQILGNQDPNNYNISYHLTQADANSGNNPIPSTFTNTSNPQTIYARVIHNSLDICFATTSFNVFVGSSPILSPDETLFICAEDGSSVTLTADSGFSEYEWSTSETTPSITVNQPGIYTVIVKNIYQDLTCDSVKQFTVNTSGIATIENIETTNWTASNNSITVLVSGLGNYEYSLDNINYQSDNTFTNLTAGNYTVYVRDINGCGIVTDSVFILNFPPFFTPNNDGYNDFWQIKFSNSEPELKVYIYDRYGKFLSALNGNSIGWDGTYNGQKMPSSDYWFTVTRADGSVFKSHFTLKR
uniref:T9SS type B sorting domain-containing protein n=1 Tax=Gelidibacter sp. TaxID=2018083 RepID=UPI004049FBB3